MAAKRISFLRLWTQSPRREWLIIALTGLALVAHIFFPGLNSFLLVGAILGSISLFTRGFRDIFRLKITIDVFNSFAMAVSFATGQFQSAAFIILMITSADLLDWRVRTQTENAVESLLKLKPQTAILERGKDLVTVPADQLKIGDVVVAEAGQAIPADGVVLSGSASVNEAIVTGESAPVAKAAGAHVLITTVVDSGALKIKVSRVGKESTIEKMAELMRQAAVNKSQPEKMADKFAAIFLPIVLLFGGLVYFFTRNLMMTAAIFLVACADDMALAIPVAMVASLGWAAKRGVIIKGGSWLETLSRIQTVVIDKTGTLTYGSFRLEKIHLEPHVTEAEFWRWLGTAEKFSEHPIGRALWRIARERVHEIPDPDETHTHKGAGIEVKKNSHNIAVGDERLLDILKVEISPEIKKLFADSRAGSVGTSVMVLVDRKPVGIVSLADVPRPEAAGALKKLSELGVKEITMFTGDRPEPANQIAKSLGIPASEVRAQMKPEDKLEQLSRLKHRPVAMIGDGINDAPSLSRADVGIAMGKAGAAIASQAADVIILNDNLDRIPDVILLGRRTLSVIRSDIAIWAISNAVGFTLVLTGFVGPAFAAFYNFATDFLPLINSSRLFRGHRMLK